MNIENDIFKKTIPNYENLEKYGFKKEQNKYIYKTKIMDNQFEAQVIIDKQIEGKLIDQDTLEEYTNIRLENIGTYANKVKNEYEKVLLDIKEKCFKEQYFMLPQSNRIAQYIIKKYNSYPEFLWKKLDGSAVFRNKKNNKWFGIIMDINKNKLDNENKIIEIINVKIREEEKENILKNKGFYEAYHMNKNNWITMILDETVSDEKIIKMIDNSYILINEK